MSFHFISSSHSPTKAEVGADVFLMTPKSSRLHRPGQEKKEIRAKRQERIWTHPVLLHVICSLQEKKRKKGEQAKSNASHIPVGGMGKRLQHFGESEKKNQTLEQTPPDENSTGVRAN
ncbi:hypothetical protein TNCV_4701721 [Trichonephila clavipes]|uniref:Uncharacterized protein n=1 Tax=Trichonephila clavipes TaxID=2585209 RepID=A0A8X6WIY7_TRICX|nr:hypothetical protein TNCV_4701721 [Trichonephila clavipes]